LIRNDSFFRKLFDSLGIFGHSKLEQSTNKQFDSTRRQIDSLAERQGGSNHPARRLGRLEQQAIRGSHRPPSARKIIRTNISLIFQFIIRI
jgi:hypothetical protein